MSFGYLFKRLDFRITKTKDMITKTLTNFLLLHSLLLAGLLYCSIADAQEWTWVSGSDLTDQSGVYGVMGTADPANGPGSRNGTVGFTDDDGRIWIYGGFGLASDAITLGRLNDLWRFDPATGEWTWIRGSNLTDQPGNYGTMGIPHPANEPPGRNRPNIWKTADACWIFGGLGAPGERRNDLWRYDMTANTWTWVKGSSAVNQFGAYGAQGTPNPNNSPGSRNGAFEWTDADDNLWLFGGFGFGASGDPSLLADLWKFDASSFEWTWVQGSTGTDISPVHGTMGTPSNVNTPGARVSSVSWVDKEGNLWLFGGWVTNFIRYNDLWKFDPASGQWTWMKGGNISNQNAVLNIADPTNPSPDDTPGARNGSVSWTDVNGNFWLYGGFGLGLNGDVAAPLNDLWMYEVEENLWYFKGGSLTDLDQPPVYGTMGTPDANNTPGGRSSMAGTLGSDGNLWLFGGINGGTARMNDLWLFSSDDLISGVDDPAVSGTILRLFPNPAYSEIHLSIAGGGGSEQWQVTIYDSLGKQVANTRFSGNELSWPVDRLPRGAYLLSMDNGKEREIRRFVKM